MRNLANRTSPRTIWTDRILVCVWQSTQVEGYLRTVNTLLRIYAWILPSADVVEFGQTGTAAPNLARGVLRKDPSDELSSQLKIYFDVADISDLEQLTSSLKLVRLAVEGRNRRSFLLWMYGYGANSLSSPLGLFREVCFHARLIGELEWSYFNAHSTLLATPIYDS